jgi:hypothetical protein
MSSTSTPLTFLDLYTDLGNRARQSLTQTDTVVQLKRYINTALIDMHIGSSFQWAERDAVLVTHPTYTSYDEDVDNTGIVVDDGLTFMEFGPTGAGNSGILDNNRLAQVNVRVGGKIKIAGESDVYTVTETGNTGIFGDQITVNSIYTGSRTAADLHSDYIYYEDEYDLASDFLRPVDLQRFTPIPFSIKLIGRKDFRERYPRNSMTGKPRVATMIDAAPSGNTTARRRIRFYPAPDSGYRIPYSYVTENLVVESDGTASTVMTNDTDEPIVPVRARPAIVLHALSSWFRDQKDDPQRAQQVMVDYEKLLSRVRADTETGQQNPRIRPNNRSTRRRARRPYRAGRGRFDHGYFDYPEG